MGVFSQVLVMKLCSKMYHTGVVSPINRARTMTGTVTEALGKGVGMLTTPLMPADFLDYVAPLRRGAELRARIEEVTPVAPGVTSLRLTPGKAWQGHVPGQYVRIGVEVDGVRLFRNYSLVSVPGQGGLEIMVKAIDGGAVSTHLTQRAAVGDLVWLGQAAGDFVAPVVPPTKVLLLVAGVGMTPVLGMLRAGAFAGAEVVLVQAARDGVRLLADAELAALPGVKRHVWLSSERGRITCDDIVGLVPDWATRDTWVCGPAGLIDACEAYWAEHGSTELLHVERFRPKQISGGRGGRVRFEPARTEAVAAGDESLLDAGEAAGVQLPFGCRMGVCFGCVVQLREGQVRDVRTGEMTTATGEADVPIQTCVSTASGDCTVVVDHTDAHVTH